MSVQPDVFQKTGRLEQSDALRFLVYEAALAEKISGRIIALMTVFDHQQKIPLRQFRAI